VQQKQNNPSVEKTGQSFCAVLWILHANLSRPILIGQPWPVLQFSPSVMDFFFSWCLNSQILLFMAVRMSGIFAPGCCWTTASV